MGCLFEIDGIQTNLEERSGKHMKYTVRTKMLGKAMKETPG